MHPERLFLTGGSGYVGRNLVRHFTSQGVEVLALAHSPRSAEVVQALGARLVERDVLSGDLGPAMSGCGRMVHAAADIGHGHGHGHG